VGIERDVFGVPPHITFKDTTEGIEKMQQRGGRPSGRLLLLWRRVVVVVVVALVMFLCRCEAKNKYVPATWYENPAYCTPGNSKNCGDHPYNTRIYCNWTLPTEQRVNDLLNWMVPHHQNAPHPYPPHNHPFTSL